MIIFGATNIGKVRKDNQDSYMFDTVDESVAFAVVCDGMGGARGGKTASSTAVNVFASNLVSLSNNYKESDIHELLEKAILDANGEIYNKSISDTELNGMGTTLVSSVIVNDTAYFANIGDSRAYLIRDGVLKRITKDHSAVQELVDQGLLTENQARNHPNKNIITRALGVDENIEFDYFVEKIKDKDIILLCTDGIINYVDDLEIPFEILSQSNVDAIPQKLIDLANSRGGSDNSTVVVIKI